MYKFRKSASKSELKLSTLLRYMEEFAKAGFHTYSEDELRTILLGHGVTIPLDLLRSMVQCLVDKELAERTVHGHVQLAN